MIFEQFIDNDLGHVSYLVACDSTKEAFIVDPRRDIDEYIDRIEAKNLVLKYIFNTHTHADYVGGHLELSSKYPVNNVFQKNAPIENYECLKVSDGNRLSIGTLDVTVMETPGHTPFDISLIVSEEGTDKLIFTGDFLFVGEIGRPDLLGEENMVALLKMSYYSARKLWQLMDGILVFASHIKGSLCGKNLNSLYLSSIGIEKATNKSFKLCQEPIDKYVENLSTQNIETPTFFKKMAAHNIAGPQLIDTIKSKVEFLSHKKIISLADQQFVDIRSPEKFNQLHFPGSINIYEKSNVSLIAGNILNYEDDIYLIGDNETNFEEVMIKLFRVGFDKVKGIVDEPCSELLSTCNKSKSISEDELHSNSLHIILDKGCRKLATNIIFSSINTFNEIDIRGYEQVIISCAFGYKSSAISSYLMKENTNIYILSNELVAFDS